jgi:hypothetical protein
MKRSYVAVALLCVAPMFAQTPSPAPPEQPDVAIFATVRAKELRFTEVPRVTVTFTGSANGIPNATIWKTGRTNLPEKVQPHVTYRDIGIRLTITSILPNIEQILDEALRPQGQSADEPAPQQIPAPETETRKK